MDRVESGWLVNGDADPTALPLTISTVANCNAIFLRCLTALYCKYMNMKTIVTIVMVLLREK